MKKLFSLMLLLATMLTFTACGSDDKNEISPYASQIIGEWVLESVYHEESGWVAISDILAKKTSIIFFSDGRYYGEGALGTGYGTYTLDDNIIRTYVDRNLYATYTIRSLVNNVAEMYIDIDGEHGLIRAIKQ